MSYACWTTCLNMAKKVSSALPEVDPLISLTDEAREHIEGLDKELTRVEGDLEAMEELGIDTSRLKERVDWARRARSIILERLT